VSAHPTGVQLVYDGGSAHDGFVSSTRTDGDVTRVSHYLSDFVSAWFAPFSYLYA